MFLVEVYESGECYKCKKRIASIHLAHKARHDRDYIDMCKKCWDAINKKVNEALSDESRPAV